MTGVAEVAREGWGLTAAASSLGDGHINDTYLIADGPAANDNNRLVLQRINSDVFVDPRGLMDNVERVVSHLSGRAPGFVPELIPTLARTLTHVDADGGYWRAWKFISGSYTLQNLQNSDQARAAGRAFARYQNLLADLPGPALKDSIAGFLRLDRYLTEFDAAASPGIARRGFITERAPLRHVLQRCEGYIHGDCKVNNLLFAAGGNEVTCVVDLDTTMRGHWAWDFGDLVRSGALDGDGFSLDLFAALADGFVGEKAGAVAAQDLVSAPRYVCFMLGVRFLTDHLQGNRYFKISAPGENLDRAERQFRLLEEMEAAQQDMARIVSRYD